MAKYHTHLLGQEEVAENTMAFHFEKPDGFASKAGQYIDLTLINPSETDEEGNTRTFSNVATPAENRITVATRMRNTAFKRVLKAAPVGLEVEIDGPMGSFVLHNNPDKPAVMLAGGIGITPLRSMIKDATETKSMHQIYLFYSNWRPEDAAFLSELQQLARENPNYKFIGTMTDMAQSHLPWTGEQGYINKEMLEKYLPDLTSSVYYIAGPPAMVAALQTMLKEAGVDSDNIRIEEFAGY